MRSVDDADSMNGVWPEAQAGFKKQTSVIIIQQTDNERGG